jgi:hypothetical protein
MFRLHGQFPSKSVKGFRKIRWDYGSKVPAVTVTVFKYRNKIGKIVVKAVPYSVT